MAGLACGQAVAQLSATKASLDIRNGQMVPSSAGRPVIHASISRRFWGADVKSYLPGHSRRRFVVRSSPTDRASSPSSSSSPPPEPVKPLGTKLDGVIQVEREESPQPTWGRIYTLGGGDLVFLLLFAAIGRWSHGLTVFDWETFRTADPFIAGWLVGSYFAGGYGPEGQGLEGLNKASVAAARSWTVGIPLALAIRGFSIGHVPPTPFIVVSLASTLVLQVGWRTAFTAIFPNDAKSFQRKKNDRKGSAFEFFELLTSLVKRW